MNWRVSVLVACCVVLACARVYTPPVTPYTPLELAALLPLGCEAFSLRCW